jgi:hypothetical protein
MTYRLVRASIATATLIASAQAADAHIVASRLGDFYTGALAPQRDAGSCWRSRWDFWLVWFWGERLVSFQQDR